MRPYELGIVLRPNLTEDEVGEVLEKFKTLMNGQGGEINKVDFWGKRRLAYLIENNHEGIFLFLNFTLPPQGVQELVRTIRLTDSILRHVLVKEQARAVTPVQTPASTTKETAQEVAAEEESAASAENGAPEPE